MRFDGCLLLTRIYTLLQTLQTLQIAGFIPTVLLFDEMLQNIFADKVSGIDCVLETEEMGAITCTMADGVAHLQ